MTAKIDGVQRRKRLPRKRDRLIRGGDVREFALLMACRVIAARVDASRWPHYVDSLTRFERGEQSGRFNRFAERVRAIFGPDTPADEIARIWRGYRSQIQRRRMSIVAEHLGGRGYRARVRLAGAEHLDAALGRGKGVILWLDNFLHHPVIGKRAFSEAGYTCWQLSSSDHGFSRSRFGHRFLNPLHLDAELKHVAGRIVIDPATVVAATRKVAEVLAGNGIVRITNNAYIGRKVYEVPFGASARLGVAATPFNFVLRTGAALLPVAPLEVEPFADYLVTVAPPLEVSALADREEAFRQAAVAYAGYLEPIMRAHPDQWRGWEGVLAGPSGRTPGDVASDGP